MKKKYEADGLNFILFLIGTSMVWSITHNWQAVVWTIVASAHIAFTIKREV